MRDGGFLEQRNRNPGGVAMVAGLHGAAIAALILFPPKFITESPPVFTVASIPADTPPSPVADKPPPPQHKTEQAVTRPDTLVKPALIDRTVDLTRIADADPVIVPPVVDRLPDIVVPDPVMTEARIDPRAAFQPAYPPRLARQDVAGNTVVRVLIGADGRVKAVAMVSATDPEFFEATKKQALRSWRFTPATRDGVAVESWRTMTVRFEMKA